MQTTPYQKNAALLKEKCAASAKFWEVHGEVDPTELPEEKQQEIKTLNREIEELSARVEESKEFQQSRARSEAIAASLSAAVDRPTFAANTEEGKNESLGYRFANSPEFQTWFKQVAPTGEMSDGVGIGQGSPAMEAKALLTGLSATSAGSMVRRDYAPLVEFPFRPLVLRDVITIGRTGSDLIEFPRVTGYTNAAAATAEATATPTSFNQASNGLKPESAMTLEKVTAAVKTIAHWIPITRRAMSDAPQIETLINNFLDTGLEIALETEMITGNGTGEHFVGLDNTPNITLQPFVTDILTTTRKSLTAARIVGRAKPSAFVMNPYDWEAFDLLKDSQGRYYWGGPMVLGQKMLWGLPVVEAEAVYQGTFYTGDLKQAILWDRERATIRISDAPNDFFLRNMLAILAELRAAFGVFRPPAIVRGDLLAGPNS